MQKEATLKSTRSSSERTSNRKESTHRYNAQSAPEVAILMDNEPTEPRDIVLRLHDGASVSCMHLMMHSSIP